MKRKTSELPTRIFAYGCKQPSSNVDIVNNEFFRAGRYYNDLIANERERRADCINAQRAYPEIVSAMDVVDNLKIRHEEARDQVRAAKAGGGQASASQIKLVKELAADLKLARSNLKDAKQAEGEALKVNHPLLASLVEQAKELSKQVKNLSDNKTRDPLVESNLDAIRKQIKEEKLKAPDTLTGKYELATVASYSRFKELYAKSGLRAGTAYGVKQAVEAASKSKSLPKFKKNDGSGRIGEQIIGGITIKELYSCQDTRVQVAPLVDGWKQLPRHKKRKAHKTVARLRVGSNPDRSPIWAEFPIYLHRELPADAIVKWVHVVRKRVGYRFEWSMQFTVESASFLGKPSKAHVNGNAVGIDLGWRDGILVGYAADNQGRHTEIKVPLRSVEAWSKPIELQSIRDENFDLVRNNLTQWLKEQSSIPEWLSELTTNMDKWKSIKKMAMLINRWKRESPMWNVNKLNEMEVWAKQDRHLLDWESNQRSRAINHRREWYRMVSKQLAETYATIAIEDPAQLKLTNFGKAPAPENGDPSTGKRSRRNKNIAAPGEFREILIKAAIKYGANIINVPPAYTSRKCNACGYNEKWEFKSEVMHHCPACGAVFHRDHNAARNILEIAGFDASLAEDATEEMLALPKYESTSRFSENKMCRAIAKRERRYGA